MIKRDINFQFKFGFSGQLHVLLSFSPLNLISKHNVDFTPDIFTYFISIQSLWYLLELIFVRKNEWPFLTIAQNHGDIGLNVKWHSHRRKGNCCTGSQGLKKVETLIWLDVCWNTTTAVRSVWNNRSDCQRKKKAVWGSLKSLSLVFSGFIYIYFHGSVKYSIFLDQRVSNDLSFLWLLFFFLLQ